MTSEERKKAATYLRKELSPKLVSQLRWAICHNPYFDLEQQFGAARTIRKIFQRGGFDWENGHYEAEWFSLLKEAVEVE